MIIIKVAIFVLLLIGVTVGIGALSSFYPGHLERVAFNILGWAPRVVSLLWGTGILFAGWVSMSIR